MYQVLKLPQVENVVAGGTAIVRLPVGGPTYGVILLNFTNITSAQADNLRVKANGKEIQFYEDVALLQDINDFYGRPAVSNQYGIFFNRPEMVSLEQQRLTGLGTLDLQSLTIEMDLDAAVSSPAITARALVGPPAKFGLCTKVKRFLSSPSAAGQFDQDAIIRGPRIIAMHFKKSDVTSVQIEDGGVPIVQDIAKADLEVFQKDYGRVPQSGFTHVDFCLEGDHESALVTSSTGQDGVLRTRNIRFLPTVGSSGNLGTYVEYLDGFAGI